MPATLDGKLVVAVSTRALFDLESENAVFAQEGSDAYVALQQQARHLPSRPGPAFSFVQKLLRLNTAEKSGVEVILLSRQDPAAAHRVFNSIADRNLPISRAFFTKGRSVAWLHAPLHTDLFLSAENEDVTEALALGVPAARVIIATPEHQAVRKDEVRIAFDGDAVLFSDEAEQVYQKGGLADFQAHEVKHKDRPLPQGPLARLLRKINHLQQGGAPIRTALITARSAPAHERALNSLPANGISVDEAFFLGGLTKAGFLEAWQADFFFDDQMAHCTPASAKVPTGHVGAAPA